MDKHRRTVIEVRADLHKQIRKLALLNDLRIYALANAIIEETLKDPEKTNALIKTLKL
jgi:hypothetical protein